MSFTAYARGVIAGVDAGRVAGAGGHLAARFGRRAAPAGAVLAVALLAVPAVPHTGRRVDRLRHEAREVSVRMQVYADLARGVELAGGAEAVNRFGPATPTGRSSPTSRESSDAHSPRSRPLTGRGAVFKSSRERLAGRVHVWARPAGAR